MPVLPAVFDYKAFQPANTLVNGKAGWFRGRGAELIGQVGQQFPGGHLREYKVSKWTEGVSQLSFEQTDKQGFSGTRWPGKHDRTTAAFNPVTDLQQCPLMGFARVKGLAFCGRFKRFGFKLPVVEVHGSITSG